MTKTWLGFPPGKAYIVLPATPAQAAINGLVLYDAVDLHQYFAASCARTAIRLGIGSALRLRDTSFLPELGWWANWVKDVAEPVVGPAPLTAFRFGEAFSTAGTTALLMNTSGHPLAFAKLKPPNAFSELTTTVAERLGDASPQTFRAPRLLSTGTYERFRFYLYEPFPDTRHRHFPDDVQRLGAVIDEFQNELSDLVPTGAPSSYVVVHRSLAPYNLRLSGNTVWLFDFDKVTVGPRLGDELYFWLRLFDRSRGHTDKKVAAIARRMSGRGSPSEVLEAVRWHETVRPPGREPTIDSLRASLIETVSTATD